MIISEEEKNRIRKIHRANSIIKEQRGVGTVSPETLQVGDKRILGEQDNELDSKGLKQKKKELSREINDKLRGWKKLTPDEKWDFNNHVLSTIKTLGLKLPLKLDDSDLQMELEEFLFDYLARVEKLNGPSRKTKRDLKQWLKKIEK